MLPCQRSRVSRSIFIVLGCGSLFGFGGCGGAATGELGGSSDGEGGTSGRTGSTGGTNGVNGTLGGSGGGGGTSLGGTGGSAPGSGGSGGSGSGGVSGSFGGVAGFSGSANAGGAGVGGLGFGGFSGGAGSSSMPGPSVCVDLSAGLAGLPSQAFPAEDAMVRAYCGPGFGNDRVYQAICLPAPINGQSCSSFYPNYLISQLYQCGGQSTASSLCGPYEPLPDTDGCQGDECCYVLVGDCR